MDLLFNDCSIHGQFSEIGTFREAIIRVMTIRKLITQYGYNLYSHRNILDTQVTPTSSLLHAVQRLTINERRALILWLTQQGPFWEDVQIHKPNDYLECNGEIVTDTAVGEAAICQFQGIDRRIISLTPSSWEFSPLPITWTLDNEEKRNIDVENYWEIKQLEEFLQKAPVPITSWEQLSAISIDRIPNLTFSQNCFDSLYGLPFNEGTAIRLLGLMQILGQFKSCFNEDGERNPEGHQIYQTHFTGQKARFTDSSDSEKSEFKNELTFSHPDKKDETLFCPWHGKVKTPQMRIHFSWPISASESLYVVYVGPKITKR